MTKSRWTSNHVYVFSCLLQGMMVLLGTALGQEHVVPSLTVSEETVEFGTASSTLDLDFQLGIGTADYSETASISPTVSDWDSTILSVGAMLTVRKDRNPLFRFGPSLWVSDEEEETWRENGELVQRDQLNMIAFELAGDIGYAFVNEAHRRLRGWLGLGIRRQEFERSDFQLIGQTVRDIGVVDETYDIGLLRLRLDGRITIRKAVFVEGDAHVGVVFFNEAENSVLGDIEGDGGTIVGGRLGIGWQLNDANRIAFGVYGEVQDLDGDTSNRGITITNGNVFQRVVEWPDNEVTLAGAEVRWTTSF